VYILKQFDLLTVNFDKILMAKPSECILLTYYKCCCAYSLYVRL